MAPIQKIGKINFEKPGKYRINVKGRLDDCWSDRLAGMRITTSGSEDEAPVTTLMGHLRDQAQLSGVLNSLYELHLPILLVEFLQDKNGAEQVPGLINGNGAYEAGNQSMTTATNYVYGRRQE